MIKRFDSWDEYHNSEEPSAEIMGPSPGGVSHEGLPVSRQTVHDWIAAGLLDYVTIYSKGKFLVGLVTTASIKRVLELIETGELDLGQGGRKQKGVLEEAFRMLSKKHPGKYGKPDIGSNVLTKTVKAKKIFLK